MLNIFRFGPNKKFVALAVKLSWPLMSTARKLSSYPPFKWIINPFFAYPYNEVTSIPINVEAKLPESVIIPSQVVEAVLRQASDIFILDECICRKKFSCKNHPTDIGCIALGPATRRMHPSHGRFVTVDEGIKHIKRAADAGLIANIAHSWVDPVSFHTVPFNRLMFICLCDDCCCLYRTHMTKRGPNLDKAYKRLPGISVVPDPELCTACGKCVDACFAAEMKIVDDVAIPSDGCKGCGRCVEICPEGALTLMFDEAGVLIDRMLERINAVADISGD